MAKYLCLANTVSLCSDFIQLTQKDCREDNSKLTRLLKRNPITALLLEELSNLEDHKLHQMLDLRFQHIHSGSMYFRSVCLSIRLNLRDGTRAASPSVEHRRVLLSLLQNVILKDKNIRLEHNYRDGRD